MWYISLYCSATYFATRIVRNAQQGHILQLNVTQIFYALTSDFLPSAMYENALDAQPQVELGSGLFVIISFSYL